MRLGWLVAFLTLVIAMTGSGIATAQGVQTGSITGTVQSSDGLPFPGASVTVSSPALQGTRTVVSDETGGYVVRALPPGVYKVDVEVAGMNPKSEMVTVALGRDLKLDLSISPATVTEAITVVGAAPALLTETRIGANYRVETVNSLAMPRTLVGVAQLAPGLTENTTPQNGQVQIAGAFAYDNVFLVDGVDINDNVFGYSDNLFIEDAIEETQVLTSSISAEYGRFSGGVINAISKRGGNMFSGTFRTNFTNPSWITETPLEQDAGIERESNLSKTYEGTFGGPIMRDRLWFFLAGRGENTTTASTFAYTNIPYERVTDNKRFEIKGTGTFAQNHTVQAQYLNDPTTRDRPILPFTIDPHAFVYGEELPNSLVVTNYRGVLTKSIFGEVQFSSKKFGLRNSGGTSKDVIESPFITISDPCLFCGHFNAPYFDATDEEDRNNMQITGNLSYFLSTPSTGRHDIKTGVERYRSTRSGGGSQTSTGYVFYSNFKMDAAGNPLYDSEGRLIPVFVPELSENETWLPIRNAQIDIVTWSFYGQDSWSPNDKWTFNLGARYEKVKSEATGNIVGADKQRIVPRLAATHDVKGNGQYIVQGSYSQYSGKYSDFQFARNSNVGNASYLPAVYIGPPGEGRSFAPGFDQKNYFIYGGFFPTANVSFEDGLGSPMTNEITTSFGAQVGMHGYVKATYAHRWVTEFIEDFITTDNGSTTVTLPDGTKQGPFTNIVYRNTNIDKRVYDAMLFQGRYQMTPDWSVDGHWTLQLKDEGNFEGEATSQPGISSIVGDYPEILSEARHYPTGRLDDYQRHKVRLWSVYNLGMGGFGDLSVSGLWRIDSALTYSIRSSHPFSSIQQGILQSEGYSDRPSSQTVYYIGRGTEFFKGSGIIDTSVTYTIPIFSSVRPWIKADIYNLFNNQKLTSWNTTVARDPRSPVDELGLNTGYIKGTNFGEATSNTNYPTPYRGETGGRAFLMSLGIRF